MLPLMVKFGRHKYASTKSDSMELHVLDRGRIYADMNFAIDGMVSALRSEPDPDLEYGAFAVWNLLIDHPEATILWDTGSHPDAGEGYWPTPLFELFAHEDANERDLDTALGEVGVAVGDIDIVVQSHLHLDHAGGLYAFDGSDVPVYIHQRELEHAYLSAKTDVGSDAYLAADFDRDLNWQIVTNERQLVEDITLLELPGHTPGMLGAHIHRAGDDVIIAGDLAFVAENYEQGRSMGASLLYDTNAWERSLHKVRDLERRTGATVLYGHDLEQFEALEGSL